MKQDARLFYCALCKSQVVICSHCDRGQMYCSRHCAAKRRSQSVQEAGKRYQQSLRGRHKHALRQRYYRQRQLTLAKIVTHQGSPTVVKHDLLRNQPVAHLKQCQAVSYEPIICHFCGTRLRWLRNQARVKRVVTSAWPFGP